MTDITPASPDTCADLDDLRQRLAAAEAERDRLVYELGHRVRNTLGVVQALASQTLRTAATPQEAMDALHQRVMALARANDAILQDGWTTAELGPVAERVLAAEAGAAGRLTVAGPPVRMAAGAALSFAMALHELATNARRHGAWRLPEGRVDLSWAIEPGEGGRRLVLTWAERGGPAVEPPARRGFGLRLVEQSLRSAFGRDITLFFEAPGFSCRASAPLDAVERGG